MSNFSSLKAAIQQYIKTNGNEEITGVVLQDILLSMVSVLGDTAINDLETALQTETTNRTNADGTLQQNINNEAMARGNADTALGNRLTAVEGAITTINTKLGEGYVYAGIATTSTSPGTPTGKVFYIATTAGTYTNFSGIELTQGINILKYNGSAWSSEQVLAIDNFPTAGSDNLVRSGGIYKSQYNLVKILDDYSFASLNITDESGNVILQLKEGDIFVKNFNSRESTKLLQDDSDASLNITDDNGNVVVQFKNGHIKTKRFDSSNITPSGDDSKSIKALFLGNSVSQDHVTYLPFLFKNTFPNVNFEFYICYCGGSNGTIKKYATDIASGAQNIEIFSSAINTDRWTNENNVSFDDVLDIGSFDVISIQPWAYDELLDDLSYAPSLINHLMTNIDTPFEVACLINQNANDFPTGAVNACKTLIEQNPISILLPPGIAFNYGREEFGSSFMSPDGTHANEGLPCMLTAYTIFITLCRKLGIYDKVLGNRLRMTQAIWDTLNIPGPNGGSLHIGTEEQYQKSQKFAVESVNIADHIFNIAIENKYNNLIN